MVLRFQKQPSGKEAESKLNESENKEESKCSDNHTKAVANQEAASPNPNSTNAQIENYSFDQDIGYGVDVFGSEFGTYDSSNYAASNFHEPEIMNQDFDCVEGHLPHDNTANDHESHRNTTDKPSTGRGVLSFLSKKRDAVAAADSSSFATTNDGLPAKNSDDASSPGTSNHVANSGDNETDEMKSPLKKPKDNHSESLDSSDLNQDSNLNSNDVMESSTSNVSLALSNNDSFEIENVARKVDGQNAPIDSFSFSNDTPKEANTGSNAVVHASNETSSLKERAQGQQNILANTVSVSSNVRTAEMDVNVLQVQESDPYLQQDKTTNENDIIVTKERGIELSAGDSITKDKEENEQDHQHGHDAPSLSAPTNSSPPSKLQEKNVTIDMSVSNVVGKEQSPSETRQNLTIIDVNAHEQRASHQDMVVAKSIVMNKDTLVNVSGAARNSQEDASRIQIGQSSANIEIGKNAKFDRRVSKQIDNGAKPVSNVFVSPTPRHGGRQHAVVRTFSTTTNGGTRIIPEAPVRGANKSTKNVFQPITPSPPPLSRDAAAKQSDSSSIGTGKSFPNSGSGTIVTSGKAKMHEQLDPKVANKVSTFSSPSLTNAVSSRKTGSAMSFDELLQEFTNDLTESGDTVKRSCANLIDLNVKLCTSQSVALRIHAAFDDLLEEAQMLCDL